MMGARISAQEATMHVRGVTAAVVVAAMIGIVVGAVAPWEVDWAAGRNRKPAAKVIYAVVRDDEVLLRGDGAKAAERTAEGFYEVTFDRPVGQCAWVATPIDPGLVTTVDSPVGTVLVNTLAIGGNAADLTFSLQVAC
jgi:hypothetical protein